jgi:hypothetical protein
MRNIPVIIIVIITVMTSCRQPSSKLTPEIRQEILDSLENIAVSFLQSWEPPFQPDRALKLFTKTGDFYLVIDGLPIENYKEWETGVPNFMSDDDYFFKSYRHEINSIHTVALSPVSGVVTITYIWHNVSREGIQKQVPGSITLTCRKEPAGWKIVHYHGSHDEEKVIDE